MTDRALKGNLERCKRRALYGNLKLPTEEQDQTEIFDWVIDLNNPKLNLLFAIPNGAYVHIRTAKRLRLTGLKSGVPDMFLPVPSGEHHGLFVELKRLRPKGVLSTNQKYWVRLLSAEGYRCEICYGSEEAKEIVLDYINSC